MKRSRNTETPRNKQKSINSYFTPSPTVKKEGAIDKPTSFSSGSRLSLKKNSKILNEPSSSVEESRSLRSGSYVKEGNETSCAIKSTLSANLHKVEEHVNVEPASVKGPDLNTLNCTTKVKSREDLSPVRQSKKLKIESISSPGSPDVIPATPPAPVSGHKPKVKKGKSVSRCLASSINSEVKKSIDIHTGAIQSNATERESKCLVPGVICKSSRIQSDSKESSKKIMTSPVKLKHDPSRLESTKMVNTFNAESESFVKTDDDEVLQCMLEQLTPKNTPNSIKVIEQGSKTVSPLKKKAKELGSVKSDNKEITGIKQKGSSTYESDNVSTKNMSLKIEVTSTDHDEVLQSMLEQLSPKRVALSTRKTESGCRKKISSDSLDKKLSANGRRSIQSPLPSEVCELRYPPLHLTMENFKTKCTAEEQTPIPCEKNCSPSSSTLLSKDGPASEMRCKPSLRNEKKPSKEASCSPVRRSPRKHPSSVSIPQEVTRTMVESNKTKKLSPLKSGGKCEAANKENKNIPSAPAGRSPQKQLFASPLKRVAADCKNSDVLITSNVPDKSVLKVPCVPNLSELQLSLPQSSNNINEWNNITGECDDVTSFIANMNEEEMYPLELDNAQLCEVTSITVVTPSKEALVHVKSVEKHKRSASCRVRGCWLACPVSVSDVISLEAVRVGNDWLLDNDKGFLVIHPDLLISGTMVVGSLFCARRSVLSSLFRGMDSDSPIMVVGSLVHQLLQMALLKKKRTETELKQLSEQLISSKQSINMLYAANMTVAHIAKELSHFIPRIAGFLERYVVPAKAKRSSWLGAPSVSPSSPAPQVIRGNNQHSKDWQGKITGICDIEETLWEPRLGIKGMVDVSVEVEDIHGTKKVLPLELKTGKASFSAEHRGQVTLYAMMMSRMGQAVDSGLLLYLREGQLQEISVSKHEQKDLLQLRNTLAHYLLPRKPVVCEKSGQFLPLKLPNPINFENACKKCPYATLCSVYLKEDGLSDLPADHPMVSISSLKSQSLSQSHIDYFRHWVSLLLLEESDQLQSANLRFIWRFSPEEREKSKQAIVNLRLLKPGVEKDAKYHHVFSRKLSSTCNSLSSDLRDCGLQIGDYILISTDRRLAMERGSIISIDSTSVTVSTNRNLYDRHANETFHLDASESNTVLVFNLTNLGCLLDENEVAVKLRGVIIDRVPPTFSSKTDKTIIQRCLAIFRKLNRNQRNALVKTLQADSYLLIKGLPGTGKTATMVALVELLVQVGMSVLVTSHTHSAVDNLLLRLKKAGLKFIRLGTDARIHPQIRPYSETSLTQHCKTPEDLDNVYSQQHIVGVTCLGAGHAMLSKQRIFDVCLVDESTQVLQPSILRPLFCARRFVLVGDPEQLPPVVRCHQAQTQGLAESLFVRLDSEAATVSLTLNYRMNRVITELANGLTYGGELKCGNDEVAGATLLLTSSQVYETQWLMRVLSTDIDDSVMFVDTSGATLCPNKENYLRNHSTNVDINREAVCSNSFELSLVMELLNALIDGGITSEEIGVIAPYRAQVALLTEAIKSVSKLADVEVNTVDQFQGRDKQVIIYSCTRSDGAFNRQHKEREILNDQRRLTVAITRAKHKLVLIGHSETLQLYAPFQKLFSCLSMNNIVPVN